MRAVEDDPTTVVRCLLIEGQGVPARKVTPGARIVHDLGVDGDDVAELLEELHKRFGTDFSALEVQWRDFFNTEGASPRAIVFGILAIIGCGFLGGVVAAILRWPPLVALALTLGLFVALWWLVARWFGRDLKPLTVEGLSEIVEVGRWPSDPANVR